MYVIVTKHAYGSQRSSEISHLNGVIVHTPGPELSWIHPRMKHELLFDDIIFEEDAREEHLDMIQVFKTSLRIQARFLKYVH